MKSLKYLTLPLLAAILTTSCDSPTLKGIASKGAPYEMIVVANHVEWDSPLGDTVRAVMGRQVEMINTREPIYTLLRITPSTFGRLNREHRNILILQTGPSYEAPAMTAQYDLYATPQIVVSITGPDGASAAQYVSDHREDLVSVFEIAERERSLDQGRRFGDKTIEREIFDKFGFNMNVGKGFLTRKTADNFMWISFEHPLASQGVAIYSYPYTDRTNFTADSLVANRNRFMGEIPGPREGSYMITYDELAPKLSHMRINGRYWAELRGFWEVEGDYMGGPFVSYSTLDTEKGRVVTIDLYVYSPEKPKRNYLRKLEHMMYSVSFPADAAVVNAVPAPAAQN